jgi:V-type H+-transporting ATPase subunit d
MVPGLSVDFKMQLTATDYGNFLANETPPIATSTISERATARLVDEFNYIKANSVQPLTKFLDYMTYAYMIDNVSTRMNWSGGSGSVG